MGRAGFHTKCSGETKWKKDCMQRSVHSPIKSGPKKEKGQVKMMTEGKRNGEGGGGGGGQKNNNRKGAIESCLPLLSP